MVSTQEQLACSAQARPTEVALTRRTQEQLACSAHARPAEVALTRHTQEQLACSAHARPAEVALTRLTVHRPGQVSASPVALPRCGEAPPLLQALDSGRGLLTPGLRVLPIFFFFFF